MPRGVGYPHRYDRIRRQLLDPPVLCAHCQRRPANTLDHHPPLAMHRHVEGSRCCHLIPSCTECNREGGQLVQQGRWRPDVAIAPVEVEPEPERDGLPWSDRRWRVPWLKGLRRPPADASWPRLMSVPHRRAVGSLGPEFIRWAEVRRGRPLRWWQRLAATRMLEVDADGSLCWETILLSTSRQVGKSWLLSELAFWRIHQYDRFGEPQDVLHTGKDLKICIDVQRDVRRWAKGRPEYRVREANGQVEIELLETGSRWMLFAKESVYGFSVSLAAVDEAWKVAPEVIEEGVDPTMVEREQPQLLLVSTAHRKATSLMLGRRSIAVNELEAGDGLLLIEWSAPPAADIDDEATWRQASAAWSRQRERKIREQLAAALEGTLRAEDEPDPIESFRAQWLNQWPRRLAETDGKTEPLLPPGLWGDRQLAGVHSKGPLWVALEDDVGYGAAVAAVGRLDDGRLEVDAWLCQDWDSAVVEAQRLAALRPIRQLIVGASLLDRIPPGTAPAPQRAGGTETRTGLALLRDLAVNGQIVHDETTYDLDMALAATQVREAPTGLFLIARGPTHLVRALVWAVGAAHKPSPVPAIR